MEPEMSQGVDASQSSQDADHTARVDSAAVQTGAPRGARVTQAFAPDSASQSDEAPVVERSSWLRDDDYWRKVTYISATGRRPGDRIATRPLPRPDRFHKRSPLQSIVILTLVIALIILIPVGVVMAARAAAQLTLPSVIPGISQPTASPVNHATVTPTATPKKK